jgi:hypothetical protein
VSAVRWTSRWSVAVMAAALGVGALGGCSSGEPEREVPQLYRDQIDQMFAAGYLTEYEQGVLEDYWVTDEEYAQTREIVRACMEERDYVVILEETQISVYPRPGGPAEGGEVMDAALMECEDGVIRNIESMYGDMRANPEGWDWHEAMVRCAELFELDEGRGLSQEEMWAGMDESEAFLWPCRMDPWLLARTGDWPYDAYLRPPPGAEPFTPRPVEP